MTPENIYDEILSHIDQERYEAIKQGVKNPEIRVVMTYAARNLFLSNKAFQRTYSCGYASALGCDMEFNSALITIIPGDDLFFHTRCTNLPTP